MRHRRAFSLVASCCVVAFGACAEGTKVEVPGGGTDDVAGLGGGHSGGVGGSKNAGTTKGVVGGVPGKTSSPGKLSSAGAPSASTNTTSGGRAPSLSGSNLAGSGVTSGANSAAGGTVALTVPAPSSGVGIRLSSQTKSSQDSATKMALINKGAAFVDLKTVKIRYYFTIDGWTTPIWFIDWAGQAITKDSISTTLFEVLPVQPDADRYFELSFKGGGLEVNAELEIQSRLYDLHYVTANFTNDYSFAGTVGFTDRITVYVNGQLVWGAEPGTGTPTGTGGTSGAAGAQSASTGGASNGGEGAAAGTLAFAGSAGTS